MKIGDRVRWNPEAPHHSYANIGTVVTIPYEQAVSVHWDGERGTYRYGISQLTLLLDPNDILKEML